MLPNSTDRAAQPDDAPTRPPREDGAGDALLHAASTETRPAKTLSEQGDSACDAIQAAQLGVYDFDLITGAAAWSEQALAIYGGFDAPPTTVQLRARVHPLDWPKLYAARQEAERHAAAALARRKPDQTLDAAVSPAESDTPEARSEAADLPADDLPPLSTDVLHRIIRPGGELRWVRATGEYQFLADGTPRRSVGVLRDVTEEMAERARLAAEIERGRRALTAAGLGTFDFDARTEAVGWDPTAKRIFGLPDGSPDVRSVEEVVALFHPDDREPLRAAIERSLCPHEGGSYDARHRIVRPDGSVRQIVCRGVVEFAEGYDGRYAIRTVGTIEDVTDRPESSETIYCELA